MEHAKQAKAAGTGLIPHRPVRMGSPLVDMERRADGSVVIRVREALESYPRRLTERLVRWAREAPDRVFVAERGTHGWSTLNYAAALNRTLSVGQALIDRGLSPERPVMILADNSIDNAVLGLACLHTGIPYIPVNPAYALLSGEFSRLQRHIALCNPQMIFSNDGTRFEKAALTAFPDVEFVVSRDPPARRDATLFSELLQTRPTSAVDDAFAAITPDSIGKIMFTSGTAGGAKGVIYNQRMLCANRQQMLQQMAFLGDEPPVLVEWLPWHHTFGGTSNFGIILYVGGSFYIDPGKPVPGEIEKSVAALSEVAPTFFNATPSALAALFPYLRSDAAFRRNFFSELKLIHYGGAAMPPHVRDAFDSLAIGELGQRIFISSGIGSTETGPCAAGLLTESDEKQAIGLPVPGSEIKLAPVEGGRFEIRHRGPNVTVGYFGDEARTRAAFDEEGFFRTGDAGRMADPDKPELGLVFEGRLSDNFKITNGTWVNVAEVRQAILSACAPCLQDAVIVGESRDFVGALLFPDLAQLRLIAGNDGDMATLVSHPAVRAFFQAALDGMAGRSISQRVSRAILETEPLSLDRGELTAKMSVSPPNVLANRAESVAHLYSDAGDSARIQAR